MGFIFGGNTGLSPEQVKRRREIAQQMQMQSMRGGRSGDGVARNIWDGLDIGAYALAGGLERRTADRAEEKGREGANEAFEKIIEAMGGGAAPQGGGFAPEGGGFKTPPGVTPITSEGWDGHTGGGETPDWLKYANGGATRSQPLNPKLTEALGGILPDMGLSMEVFSGGQPQAGEGPRVGSTRHDHGNAADAFFYKDGQKLDWQNPEHQPIFQEIVRRGAEKGLTGFGAGERYMQPGSMHVGFGDPAVWGEGGKGENAPDWLRSAYEGGGAPPAVGGVPAQGGAPAVPQAAPMAQPGRQQVTQAMLPQLMTAMSDPYLNEGQRAVVQAMMAQAMQPGMTEYQQAQLGLQREEFGLRREQMGIDSQRAQAGLEMDRQRLALEKARVERELSGELNPYQREQLELQRAQLDAQIAQNDRGAALDERRFSELSAADRAKLEVDERRFSELSAADAASNQIARDRLSATTGEGRADRDARREIVELQLEAERNKPFTLNQGQTRFGPDGKPIASVDPKVDPRIAAAERAAPAIEAQAYGKAQNVLTSIDDAIGQIGVTKDGKLDTSPLNISGTGFYGNATGWIGGTDAYNLNRTIETIKANLGFDELQRMRAASPTGGALGSITEKELALLQSTVASLDTGQDREALFANLKRVQDIYQRIVSNIEAGRATRSGAAAGGASAEDLFGDYK